jgi:hypothetical protein
LAITIDRPSTKSAATAAGAAIMVTGFATFALAKAMPPRTTRPVTTPIPADVRARRCSGMKSGTRARKAAMTALKPSCDIAQPTATMATLEAVPTTMAPASTVSDPPTSHGRRRPKRPRVRSDRLPNSGNMTTEISAPIRMTVERPNALPVGSTPKIRMERLTIDGVRNAK